MVVQSALSVASSNPVIIAYFSFLPPPPRTRQFGGARHTGSTAARTADAEFLPRFPHPRQPAPSQVSGVEAAEDSVEEKPMEETRRGEAHGGEARNGEW